MRTSLHKMVSIENYLQQKGPVRDRLLMEAHLQLDQVLVQDVKAQQHVYALVNQYGREKLRMEIKATEDKLFRERKFKKFQDMIGSIFK